MELIVRMGDEETFFLVEKLKKLKVVTGVACVVNGNDGFGAAGHEVGDVGGIDVVVLSDVRKERGCSCLQNGGGRS